MRYKVRLENAMTGKIVMVYLSASSADEAANEAVSLVEDDREGENAWYTEARRHNPVRRS